MSAGAGSAAASVGGSAPSASSTLREAYGDGDGSAGRGPVVPGHVSLAARVLTRVAAAVVAEQLRVDRAEVRVDASDDAGHLALRVTTPVRVPALSGSVQVPAGGVVGLVRELQSTLTRRVSEITGRTVSRVDVTVSRSQLDRTGRVA
ncbi:hypothetical protein ASF82_14305 [Frigoribacterium sp. Leaf164]|nr:hypothetical protein ASF82_14305 [Frigoribacterium sp. Leaf164]